MAFLSAETNIPDTNHLDINSSIAEAKFDEQAGQDVPDDRFSVCSWKTAEDSEHYEFQEVANLVMDILFRSRYKDKQGFLRDITHWVTKILDRPIADDMEEKRDTEVKYHLNTGTKNQELEQFKTLQIAGTAGAEEESKDKTFLLADTNISDPNHMEAKAHDDSEPMNVFITDTMNWEAERPVTDYSYTGKALDTNSFSAEAKADDDEEAKIDPIAHTMNPEHETMTNTVFIAGTESEAVVSLPPGGTKDEEAQIKHDRGNNGSPKRTARRKRSARAGCPSVDVFGHRGVLERIGETRWAITCWQCEAEAKNDVGMCQTCRLLVCGNCFEAAKKKHG